jgi:hypothetical protein
MNIGKEERTIIVEPAENPVPEKEPVPEREPARQPREPEKVPSEK